jgi:hypothetical protein
VTATETRAPFVFPCEGPCDESDRPYSRARIPSVTAIIGVQDKGTPFAWSASKIASTYWANHHAELVRLDRDEAIERGRRAFQGEWAGSALIGSLSHLCGQAFLAGQAFDIPDTYRGKPVPDDVADRMPGYAEGLYRFFNDCEPEAVATEQVVRGTTLSGIDYIGTFDWLVTIRGELWLLDLKTGKPRDDLYTNENRMQLAAYRYASTLSHWHGTKEVATVAYDDVLPRAVKTGIVKMTGQGDYQLFEVDTDESLLDGFDALAKVHAWMTKGHKSPAPVVVSEFKPADPEPVAPRPSAAASPGMLG